MKEKYFSPNVIAYLIDEVGSVFNGSTNPSTGKTEGTAQIEYPDPDDPTSEITYDDII